MNDSYLGPEHRLPAPMRRRLTSPRPLTPEEDFRFSLTLQKLRALILRARLIRQKQTGTIIEPEAPFEG